MDDKNILYLINSGICTLESLANELEISLFNAQIILKNLEENGLIEKTKVHVSIINSPNSYKIKYLVTEEGKKFAELD